MCNVVLRCGAGEMLLVPLVLVLVLVTTVCGSASTSACMRRAELQAEVDCLVLELIDSKLQSATLSQELDVLIQRQHADRRRIQKLSERAAQMEVLASLNGQEALLSNPTTVLPVSEPNYSSNDAETDSKQRGSVATSSIPDELYFTSRSPVRTKQKGQH